jgi:hypothetical protein
LALSAFFKLSKQPVSLIKEDKIAACMFSSGEMSL